MNIDFNLLDFHFQTIHSSMEANGHNRDEAAEEAFEYALNILNIKEISQTEQEKVKAKIFFKYKIGMELPNKISVLDGKNKDNWYSPSKKSTFYFWNRYRRYLQDKKQWDFETVYSIDKSTDKILEFLGNPKNPSPFDKRGLVLGYVQSGKTANFTGLINKAFDVGYKLIIVLAGIHNDLRTQTQIRLEEEVVGNRTDERGCPVGVAEIRQNNDDHIVGTWTTEKHDISARMTPRVSHLNKPTLMVVKKNKSVLETLIEQLINHKRLYQLDIPVLIIDDEADQASIDTADKTKEEEPKTINKLIRQLLDIFPRRNYVGYTATPFANLLIDITSETDSEGKDLYPKDFLIGLPKPTGYCGPEEFFNTEENANYSKPSLIKHLDSDEEKLIGSIKKVDDFEILDAVPKQMKRAILSFLITIAIRNLRGQKKKHNSMLIHISRLKGVQSYIKDVIANEFALYADSILYDPNSPILDELKLIYDQDITKTSAEWDINTKTFEWNTVLKEIKQNIITVQVFAINGDSSDALDYHRYKEDGLNVIAIGGDKLSRGLTLEGLSITYYTRNTLMYDTLMQMGRWFGYREGYIDLCRIYTPKKIANHFEHLAIAMKKLREEFDYLAEKKKTPLQYAVRMLSHETMRLTSVLKMKMAIIYNARFDASLQQTRVFDASETFFRKNMKAVSDLISNLSFSSITRRKSLYHLARNVNAQIILQFFQKYQTSEHATIVKSKLLSNYIALANRENSELKNWTVAVFEGQMSDHIVPPQPVKLGSLYLSNTVMRGERAHEYNKSKEIVDIRAIVADNQEFLDLDPKKLVPAKSKRKMREERDETQGFLMIYPLNPNVKIFSDLEINFNEELVPIGVALSFPGTNIDDDEVYQINGTIPQF
ncbi:Z1 domain-containing protein [Bacillus sp. YC2]|uniref:Z1 domain-containing protein n=1 Tax=Bacillus sp. YC2 TaxID=2861287 RepID=UPI001CA7AD96|nr:Z1 domain-containing protein [Bacillus sp. YC2]MBY8911931.1 Z1 domain-containing protein [Bacillus sp. YC2]